MRTTFIDIIKRASQLLPIGIAAVTLLLSACKDEENAFIPTVGAEAFSFTPIAGGATMHYTLPADKEISGINVRYKNYNGKEILRTSSVLQDSMQLIGFNEARQNVPAEIRLVKRNGEESAPIAVNFSTEDSAPWAFFDKVQVKSGWDGFSVFTDNPKNAKGLAHVFYLGEDPLTGNPDTVLISSFTLEEGKDTLTFKVQQKRDVNTIVIRTEDFNGYMVREQVWPNIAAYNVKKMDKSQFDFTCDLSIEDDEDMLGQKYLFDGDLKGDSYFIDNNDDHYRTFLMGPAATGEPMYIDAHKNTNMARIMLYSMVNIYRNFGSFNSQSQYKRIWNFCYGDKLPCDVDVYGAKDDDTGASNWDNKQWVKLGSYKQDQDIDGTSKWCYGYCLDYSMSDDMSFSTLQQVQKADSIPMVITFPADGQGDGYRFLKIVVNSTFNVHYPSYDMDWYNKNGYVTFHELELYIKDE